MDKEKFSSPLPLGSVRIEDSFWGREQELVRTEVIPYQWDALNDRVPGAAPSFCMRNFKVAGRLMKEKRESEDFVAPSYTFRGFNNLPQEGRDPEPDQFYGFVFQDSDFSKWIEAVGYSLTIHPDPELERTADEAIDIVCAAQAENGYLDTYYIINGMDRIFTNLRDHHELYCFGHLLEGAIAYYQATGKDKLLSAAKRYGSFVAESFGPGEGQRKGYPGHEIAEMALARLYELTGEKKYLELAEFFLDQRGKKPYYFDIEEEERCAYEGRPCHKPDPGEERYFYYQANRPVRELSEATGHAVRAVYLYSGMADVARLTGDDSMLEACERLWRDMVSRKLYITGGIGGTHVGEAFSFAYDLPNDTAYSETCAAIGLAFFARRMLQVHPRSEYADVMEQALYNTVLAGMALDGRSFFYVNPLEVIPEAARRDERKSHVKPLRQKWFGCACCPPNIARIVSSLGAYIYTENRDTLFVHLYVGSRVAKHFTGGEMDLRVTTDYPWEGSIALDIHTEKPLRGKIALRIPGWCEGAKASVIRGGENRRNIAVSAHELREGYLILEEEWQDADRILLELPLEVRMCQSSDHVRENAGRVALLRGPICYCMEEHDNGKELWNLYLDGESPRIREERDHSLGHELVLLKAWGVRRSSRMGEALYATYQKPEETPVELTFLPYYAWANRGEGEMSVWVSVK